MINTSAGCAFYVDPCKGDDSNTGAIEQPFATLDKALAVVDARVRQGILSDQIYLRGGVYRKESTETLYRLNLKGTATAPSLISAMPAAPHAPGAVQRKSGRWYEKVVFDDANVIRTPWRRTANNPNIWATNPGFVLTNWYGNATWPWRGKDLPAERVEAIPFTVAPYMLLQDGEPFLWETAVEKLQPGMRTYDRATDTLYVWPHGDKDPNNCLMETWYGGPEEDGKMLLDGEGRSLFYGDMEHAGIIGCEFRMFTRLFEFKRREMKDVSEREFQRFVTFADNECRYGWIQILLDANVVHEHDKETYTRFDDRCHWHVHHNVFFRPGREVFQVHGRNHIFEFNEVIDHGGPWAGPAACVSIVNTRNTLNAQIRYNYIQGQGTNPWTGGSVFMMEVESGHRDSSGDYIFGGQSYIGNIIVNQTSGPAMVLGKGGVRVRNVTVRDNIFTGHERDATIMISSPHANLVIENNIFHNQATVLACYDNNPRNTCPYDALPSTITIRRNIFLGNKKTLDPHLFDAHPDSKVTIEENLFYNNGDAPLGKDNLFCDPQFKDVEKLDFRPQPGSPLVGGRRRIGVYSGPEDAPIGMDWWRLAQ